MLEYLITTLSVTLLVNIIGFSIAFFLKTDKLTDFSYALSFVLIIISALFLTGNFNTVTGLLTALISLWALRLSSYLLVRIRAWGRDRRFDDIRNNFIKFLGFWLFQAVTAWIVLLAPLLFIFVTDSARLQVWNILGAILFIAGLKLEAIADIQLFRFTQNKKNKGQFISAGVWKFSRHPNYLGEVLVWFGAWVFTLSTLSSTTALIGLLSPLFIYLMLRYVSGVPKLEESAAQKWGNNPNYQMYKKNTGLIFPKFGI
jgi:steroid 5-alpha reductase family enzyme